MEPLQPRYGRAPGVKTYRTLTGQACRSGLQAIVFGTLVLAVCLLFWAAVSPAWGAVRDRPSSASPGFLAGRTTVPSPDQSDPTSEPTSTPGQVTTDGTAPQQGPTPAVRVTASPAAELEASQQPAGASVQKPAPSSGRRSSNSAVDWTILLSDTFDYNVRSWDVGAVRLDAATLHRTVADGIYNWDLDVRRPLLSWSEPAIGLLTDFYAAVDARLLTGTPTEVDFGLAVRSRDLDDMVLFLASPARGVTLQRGIDDSAEMVVDWIPTDAIRSDAWNRLAIRAVDSQVALYVNDQPIAQVTGESFSEAQLGIVVRVSGPGHSIVQFDSFEVRPAPGSTVIAPVVSAETISPPSPPSPSGEVAWARVLSETHRVGPPDWPIVFWDTFDDNGNGWVTYEDFDRQMEASKSVEGTLAWQFKALQAVHRVVEVPHPEVADFYAAVDVKRYSGPEDVWYGLAFRQADPNHFYSFLVNDNQKYQIRAQAGASLYQFVDSTQSEAIRRGGPNRLAVMAEGARLTFFINSQPIIELDVESDTVLFPEGALGLVLGTSEGDVGIMEFDNFELRTPTGS